MLKNNLSFHVRRRYTTDVMCLEGNTLNKHNDLFSCAQAWCRYKRQGRPTLNQIVQAPIHLSEQLTRTVKWRVSVSAQNRKNRNKNSPLVHSVIYNNVFLKGRPTVANTRCNFGWISHLVAQIILFSSVPLGKRQFSISKGEELFLI